MLDLGPTLGQQTWTSALLLLTGSIFVFNVVFTIGRMLCSLYILPGKPLASFGPKGSWALVTGASDGIGKEYARQIAAKGFNVILASRTKSKMDDIAKDIIAKNPDRKVEVFPIDFANATDQDYKNLAALLEGKRLAILVNNVGVSHSMPVPYADIDWKEAESIVNVNCYATLKVTDLALPHMRPYQQGLILNMGSMGGLVPTPLLSVYSGSKAFLQAWSNAIAGELELEGITVFYIHAYLITSAMSKVKKPNWAVPTEKNFVRTALSKIGRRGGSIGYAHTGSPFWSHGIATALFIKIIGVFGIGILNYNRGHHVQVRMRALNKIKKLEAEKQQQQQPSQMNGKKSA